LTVSTYKYKIKAIGIIKNVQNKLDNIFCEIGISVHEKFKKIIEKNTGFETIIKLMKYSLGKENV